MKNVTFTMRSGLVHTKSLDISSLEDLVKDLRYTKWLTLDNLSLNVEFIESIKIKESSNLDL